MNERLTTEVFPKDEQANVAAFTILNFIATHPQTEVSVYAHNNDVKDAVRHKLVQLMANVGTQLDVFDTDRLRIKYNRTTINFHVAPKTKEGTHCLGRGCSHTLVICLDAKQMPHMEEIIKGNLPVLHAIPDGEMIVFTSEGAS
jgi:hypothetical protein